MINNVNKLKTRIVLLVAYHPIGLHTDVVVKMLVEEIDHMPKFVVIYEGW